MKLTKNQLKKIIRESITEESVHTRCMLIPIEDVAYMCNSILGVPAFKDNQQLKCACMDVINARITRNRSMMSNALESIMSMAPIFIDKIEDACDVDYE